jgi:hypothetical protein
MGSQNDGDPKDPRAPRRGRLFEVSPPPEVVVPDAAAASESADASAEPLTEPIAPLASEDVQSIDSGAVAPVEDASATSAKLARDERMKKPVPASSYIAKSKAEAPGASLRRSAPDVALNPAPRRRGLGWLWAFLPAVLLVAALAALYFAGYRIGPQGLVPPPHAATR